MRITKKDLEKLVLEELEKMLPLSEDPYTFRPKVLEKLLMEITG